MPLINGQKMACEPCIRGHRSTKCTHANERLMVPVRKPGRPLSTCPHPASRPCSCGRVTAAIPKKQKCGCGTNNNEAARAGSEDEPHKETTPQSPTKSTNAGGYRIHKSTGKNAAASRKQSVDNSGLERLERMDPTQLNIMPTFNGLTPTHTPPSVPDMSNYGPMGITNAGAPFLPMMFPMFQPQMPPPMLSPDGINPSSNGHTISTPSGIAVDLKSKPVPKLGSCCGGGGNTGSASPPTQPSTAASSPKISNESNIKSCCSSKVQSPKTEERTEILPPSDLPTPNSVMISPFQTPMMIPNGMFGFYPQPNIFTYPPNYGSYMHPLQPEQWRQVMASMNFGQGTVPFFNGMPGTVPYNPPNTPQTSAGTSHQCSCGDTCQCIGCAAHPYNDATKDYVRSAWESMLDETHASAHMNGSHTPNTNGISNGNAPTVSYAPESKASPNLPQTPSDAASGLSEEQALPANDFFFVDYSFDDACGGEMANCPCGDDCQCLGCVIHNNPGPEEDTERQVSAIMATHE